MEFQDYSAENPYAAPPADADLVMADSQLGSDSSQDEVIRREYLSHEASVRSVGTLYYLGSFLLGFSAISMAAFAFLYPIESDLNPTTSVIDLASTVATLFGLSIYLSLSALLFCTARGLRSLRPWARISSGIISAIGLIGFPFGTIINVFILYLLISRKSKVVFSPEYRDIIARTPHIKYKTSLIVKILAIILLGFLALGVISAIISV